jgi:hypothetical protein
MGQIAESHTFQTAAEANGNGTALNVRGLAGVGVQVEGVTTATINFEGTIDGSTWYALEALALATGAKATTTAADGLFLVPVAGVAQFRCRISGYSAGTITVTGLGVVHPQAAHLADVAATAALSGDLPDTAAGDLAAISAALAGALAIGSVALPSVLVHGQTTVTTAGTEVALGASTALTSGVRVKALSDNAGSVYVGANPVTSSTGFELAAGEEVFIEVANLATVYVDAAAGGDGDGVCYIGG